MINVCSEVTLYTESSNSQVVWKNAIFVLMSRARCAICTYIYIEWIANAFNEKCWKNNED